MQLISKLKKPFIVRALFSEIVACEPSEVVAVFDRFEEVRGNLTLHHEIDVLNVVFESEVRQCA